LKNGVADVVNGMGQGSKSFGVMLGKNLLNPFSILLLIASTVTAPYVQPVGVFSNPDMIRLDALRRRQGIQ
jgi:hypothetical protein